MSWQAGGFAPLPEYIAEARYPSGEHVACQVFDADGVAQGPELELLEGLQALRGAPFGWELRRCRDGRVLARKGGPKVKVPRERPRPPAETVGELAEELGA